MRTVIENILKDSEEKLISELKDNYYLISEHDIQSTHYSILKEELKDTECFVSTEWSFYKEEDECKKMYGRFDLVVCKQWKREEEDKWKYKKNNKKDCYKNNVFPIYLAEYKIDDAPTLNNKLILPFYSQCKRIVEKASSRPEYKHYGFCLFLHRTKKQTSFFKKAKKTGQPIEIPEAIKMPNNLILNFKYLNSSWDSQKNVVTWSQKDLSIEQLYEFIKPQNSSIPKT